MQPIVLCKQRASLLGCLVSLTGGLLLAGMVSAQTPSVGKLLYERLTKTKKEYKEALATGDSLNVAEVCYLMGKRYSSIGDFLTAQAWFIRSLRIREPLGPSEDIGKVYLRMTENQSRQKHYLEAMRYARRAVANFEAVHSNHGMMSADILLAGIYESVWQLNLENPGSAQIASRDSALFYSRHAERLALALKKPYDIANVYACVGNMMALHDSNKAILYLKKAHAINLRLGQTYGIINQAQQLANCYLVLGQPTLAKRWLDEALFMRNKYHQGDQIQNVEIEEAYIKFYQQTGQWKQAFDHQRKYYLSRIEAVNGDREGAISRIEMLYESEKKEVKLNAQQKELALRQENLKTQERLTLVTTFLFILTGIACLILYWLFRKYQRTSEQNAKLVKEQNHRVKNNLQSITNLLGLQVNRLTDSAARQAVEESLLRVEAMALVHQRLYDGDRLVEVDITRYIPELVGGVLRSFNFGHVRPVYTIKSIWLQADVAINVGLLLNELVTNSCKYAFPLHPNPVLEIGCLEEHGQILIRFSDNGPGFIPTIKGNSFGMKLIDLITEKLKGNRNFKADKGCRFTLSFNSQASVMSP